MIIATLSLVGLNSSVVNTVGLTQFSVVSLFAQIYSYKSQEKVNSA